MLARSSARPLELQSWRDATGSPAACGQRQWSPATPANARTHDMSEFNVNDFLPSQAARYERRINELQAKGFYTTSIELAVDRALANIADANARSFVIYGEPQSGKTEMMIA